MLTKITKSLSSKKKAIKDELEKDFNIYQTDYSYNFDDYYNQMNTMAITSANSGVYTISTSPTVNTTSITGTSTGSLSLSTGAYNWASTTVSPTFSATNTYSASSATFDNTDVTLTRKGRPPMKIGATLDLILESLYIITPDETAHKDNPALQSAYEEWQHQFRVQTERMAPLKEAYESYMTMKKLCREDEE